jgi:hypothetical protein
VTSPEQKQSPQQAARRKLVRGAFAVPAVMTVVSGSAFATSSSMRCLANQVTNSPTTKGVMDGTVGGAAPADGWVRVELWKSADGATFYVRGSDLNSYFKRTGNSVYLTNSEWQVFDPTTNLLGAKVSAPMGASASGKFASVRFDSTGSVVGLGGSGANGSSALPSTCWSSFAPSL